MRSTSLWRRIFSAAVAVAGVVLLATCDLDKLTPPAAKSPDAPFDSTELVLAGGNTVTLGGTATMAVTSSSVPLGSVVKRYYSASASFITVDSITGVMTGVAVTSGTGVKMTAKILAPELGTGVTISQNVRVRYKGIKFTSPLVTDSIQGLGLAQNRTATVFGVNNANANVVAVTPDSVRSRDTTIFRVSGATISARKNGTAQVVAFFDGFRDSVAVRVRQVAKTVTFPTTDYTARHLNFNLTVPVSGTDVTDSALASPAFTWRTKDTTTATIGTTSGVLRVKKLGTDSVWAKMDGIEKGQKIVVSQVLGSLSKFAGDARSDTVAKNVTVVPTVTVLDSGATPIVGASVLFKPGIGLNAMVQDTLQVTDVNGRAKPTNWKLGDFSGTNNNTLIATSGIATTTFTVSAMAGAARKLSFAVQPTSVILNGSITPAIQVQVRDSLGNLVTTATNTVTLSLSNNPGAATPGGTLSVAAVAGVATFNTVSLNAGGSGYTLQASAAGLTGAISNAFDSFGSATKLGFSTQPVGPGAGSIMAPVRVAVQDASGNTVATSTANIVIAFGTNPTGTPLLGTLSAAAVAGVATFSTLAINTAGSGYTFQTTSSGLTSATSDPFNVSPVGSAAKLFFLTQPQSAIAGASLGSIQVQVQDANGACVCTSTQQVTLAIDPTANPGSSLLAGGSSLTATASGGVATFGSASLDRTGTGYKLTVSATSLTGATSNTFNVTPGTGTKLGFIQPPTNTVFSQTMASVTVAMQDANSNTVTSVAATSIALTLTGCSATLGGTNTANTASGIATFSALSIATQVSNCTLLATSSGLTAATSTSFNIVAANGAVKLGFLGFPVTPAAGGTIGTMQVALQDASGATVTTAAPTTVTMGLGSNPGGASLTGTLTATTTSGIAQFSGNTITVAATGYRLSATANGYQIATGGAFDVLPGIASRVRFLQQPTTSTAGVPFSPTIRAAIQDEFGNTVTSSSLSVRLQFHPSPSVALLESASTDIVPVVGVGVAGPAVNGVATFTGLRVKKANTGYNIIPVVGTFDNAVSNSFNIDKAPASVLAFSVQPTTSYTAGSTFSVTVQTQDSVGNAYTDAAGAITLSLTGGTSGAVLSGTKTVTPVAGSATFSNLSIDKAGSSYQLNASSSGFSTNPSSTLTINPGTASKLTWVTQPQATFLNAALVLSGQPAKVEIQDALGNTIIGNSSTTVRIAVGVGPSPTFKSSNSPVTLFDMTPTNGVATIPGTIFMTTTGTYQLTASTPFSSLTGANSASFTVGAFDVKSKLAFGDAATNGTYGVRLAFSPGPPTTVNVNVLDQYNNLVTAATDAVTVAIGIDANPTTTLAGGGATAAVGGTASFPVLTVNKAGTGFTLAASAAGLTSATSSAFGITSPGVLTTGTLVNDMVRLGNTIYFLHSNALKSVAVTGGTVTTLASTTNPYRVVTDGTNIYWVEGGATNSGDASVKKLTVGTGAVSTLAGALTNVQTRPYTFATDGTNVYFVARNTPASGYAIRSISVNANNGVATDLYGNVGTNQFFMVSGGLIYFADAINNVRRMTTAGASVVALSTGFSALLALDGTTLYFSDGQTIMSITNANTISGPATPTSHLTVSAGIANWALDGANLYVNTSATLRKYALSNFASFATVTSSLDQGYQSILIDGTDAYFQDSSAKIVKLPK